jgi:hypothetical protein
VAADVAVTHDALEATRGLLAGRLDAHAAQAKLLGLSQRARSLGARIDLEALRVPFHDAVQGLFDRAVRGDREAAAQLEELVALGGTLGMHFDLWTLQNALWEAVRTGTCTLEREPLSRLARALWFDEAAIAGRAQRASRPAA